MSSIQAHESIHDWSLQVGAATHRGHVREENQDRISRFKCPRGEVFLVADGMGGHHDGGRAAEEVIRSFERLLADPFQGAGELALLLQQCAAQANTDLLSATYAESQERAPMGATLVLLLVVGRTAVIAHAGDCRAYHMRRGVMRLLTRDHTLVQRMVEHGALTPQEARVHPQASVVTRAFGQAAGLELEIAPPLELRAGDRLLLCSDGLTGYVDDAEIGSVMKRGRAARQAAAALLELALDAGGEDNVGLQVIDVEMPARDGATRRARAPERSAAAPSPPAAAASPTPLAMVRASRLPWLELGLAGAALFVVLAIVASFHL